MLKEMGRNLFRPALRITLWVATAGILASCTGETARGPIATSNVNAAEPVVTTLGSARHVVTVQPAEHLMLDTLPPDEDTHLLWFAGRQTQQTVDGAVVLDGSGGLIRFDEGLRVRRVLLQREGREIVAATAGPGDRLWVADLNGDVMLASLDGSLKPTAKSPFNYTDLGSDGQGGVWLVRSPARFAYALESPDAPLLSRIGADGTAGGTTGLVDLPQHILLADLNNAGHVAGRGDTVYFAPFIRDQILALTAAGETLWVASRDLPQSTTQPKFELQDGKAVIDYHPVNLGATIGPDDRLYVLSTPGFTTDRSRLDVFDRTTGVLLRTAELPVALPTIAVGNEGRVFLLNELQLLTGLSPTDREPIVPFELEQMGGGQMANTDLRGKVTLVNFWASWCAPCREEMPALDSLRHAVTDSGFRFITINEDIHSEDAEAFISQFGSDFPVLLGKGDMKAKYHYFGLPYTILVDRDGKLVQQWIGFAGPDQIARIRAVIDAELQRTTMAGGDHGHEGGH